MGINHCNNAVINFRLSVVRDEIKVKSIPLLPSWVYMIINIHLFKDYLRHCISTLVGYFLTGKALVFRFPPASALG